MRGEDERDGRLCRPLNCMHCRVRMYFPHSTGLYSIGIITYYVNINRKKLGYQTDSS